MCKPLDNLPPLREVISAHGLRAEKALGQNFLLDQNITDKIVRQVSDISGKTVIEIGSGPGGLTRSLLKSDAAKVIAVEFDGRAVEALQSLKEAAEGRLEIVQADALQTDLLSLCAGPRIIVANLPYNIATPLLTGWLKQIHEDFSAYDAMLLMFQKEVADRITSKSCAKSYGRLSVISQWICDVKTVMDLPASAFTPPPKVKSSVVRFIPKKRAEDRPAFESVEKITAAAFGQRRKMIRSSLKDHLESLVDLGIDPQRRAETLEPSDFIEIAKRAF